MRMVFMLDKEKARPVSAKPKVVGTPIEIDGTMYSTSSSFNRSMMTSTMNSTGSRRSSTKKSSKTRSRPKSRSRKTGVDSLNKSVTWGGMESYGYAAVMDTFPGPATATVDHKKEKKNTTWSTGTLGSGHYHPKKRAYTSMEYVKDVKSTYSHKYSVYQEFIAILSEVKDPDSDKMDIIKRIITLFEGYPHLIEGFNFFLPPNIVIEVQDDAVVVMVDEGDLKTLTQDSDEEEEDSPTVRYIRNVKWTYNLHPEVYPRFSKVLKKFHKKEISEVETIHCIVSLFRDHPDLVLGFNFFLPTGYKVLQDKRHGYVIQHPAKKGMKPQHTPVNVDDDYVE